MVTPLEVGGKIPNVEPKKDAMMVIKSLIVNPAKLNVEPKSEAVTILGALIEMTAPIDCVLEANVPDAVALPAAVLAPVAAVIRPPVEGAEASYWEVNDATFVHEDVAIGAFVRNANSIIRLLLNVGLIVPIAMVVLLPLFTELLNESIGFVGSAPVIREITPTLR